MKLSDIIIFCTFGKVFRGNAQFVQNTIFGLLEKMIAQLRKMFSKISMNICATISFMLLANLFTFSDYVGLCKEQSTKHATYDFQCRAL